MDAVILSKSQFFLNLSISPPVDINVQANSRWYNRTCLHTACYYGNSEMIKLLLEYNANYEIEDANNRCAWQIAEEMQHYNCVELLLNEMGKSNSPPFF